MELSVEGYKSIASKQTLRFDGLTVMAGANSSGKSSFMQPFLMLKQTVESHYDSGVLELYGENVKLTDSSQIISKVPRYNRKSFSLEMRGNKSKCGLTYKYKRGHGLQVESATLENDRFKRGIVLKPGMSSDLIDRSIPDEDFKFIKEFYSERKLKAKWKAFREKCFIQAELSAEGEAFPLTAGIDPTQSLENFVTRLIHVPGLRGNPERIYKVAASDDIYPGSFEKYVASIISDWSRYKKFESKYGLLKEQLVDLGLAGAIKASKIDDTSIEIKIARSKQSGNEDCVNVADVGFGVSQTIPVLVALIGAKKGQCVYIEQPELHLHPRAQFKLASIIMAAVNKGVRVVIETHSSILIRGIQIAVVKSEVDRDKVSLNWFTQNSQTGETEVSRAKLDRFGAFGDWPEDFDDVSLKVEQMYLDAVEEAANE